MAPTFVKTDDATLERTENEVAVVLVHLKKLLRLENWLRSPLLRLPTETIAHILSYIMEDAEHPSIWRPIFNTCYRIHNIMSTTTGLWRKADFTSDRLAQLAFARSQGNLEVIIADLLTRDFLRNECTRDALGFCRDNLVLRGHRFHTLDVCGYPSDIANFSWILERPLPSLEHVKIHFYPPWEGWGGFFMENPVVLQLPTDLPLRMLNLGNAVLPWSSSLFTGLRELHLDFADCESLVEISEEELLGILGASPRLESLTLLRLMPKVPIMDYQRQYTPTRIVKFTSLASLNLDSFPELVGYILACVDIPAITSLKIRAEFSPWEVRFSLDHFFPDDRLPDRLFPNPPIFEVWPDCGYGIYDSLKVKIGSAYIQFDFEIDENAATSDAIMSCILPLVPPSVTTLRLDHSDLDKHEWMEFFRSHSEVRSIECSTLREGPISESLWDALSPAGADAITPCPKLESISLSKERASTPLLNCLLNRKTAGFGLRCLKVWEVDNLFAEQLGLLVEELQVINVPDKWTQRVRPVLIDENRPRADHPPSGETVCLQRSCMGSGV
jgi:hypothetical protein